MNTRIKKSDTAIPKNIEEADKMLGELGRAEAELQNIELSRKKALATVEESFKQDLARATKVRDEKFLKLFTFAQPKRNSLIDKVKTLFWKNGTIGWRFTPPKVEMEMNDEKLIQVLKRLGLKRYIRTKEEVSREDLLKDMPNIPNVRYAQREEFVAKPKFSFLQKWKTKTITKTVG